MKTILLFIITTMNVIIIKNNYIHIWTISLEYLIFVNQDGY